MAITEKQAIEYIGIDLSQVEDIDSFKEQWDAQWIKKAEVHKDEQLRKAVFGKQAGVLVSKTRKLLQELGDEASESELREARLEDLVDRVRQAADAHYKPQLDDLGAKLKAAVGGSKEQKDWAEKYAALEKKAAEYQGLVGDLQTKLKSKDEEFAARDRQQKIDSLWNQAIEKAPLRKDLDRYARHGFLAEIRSKYQVLFDEEGNPYTADAQGNRIKDTARSNSFLDLDTVIANEVKAAKLDAANPHAHKPVNQPALQSHQPPAKDQKPDLTVRRVHPAAAV